jgi:hypothetical protein
LLFGGLLTGSFNELLRLSRLKSAFNKRLKRDCNMYSDSVHEQHNTGLELSHHGERGCRRGLWR